jgi:hypothetical protein
MRRLSQPVKLVTALEEDGIQAPVSTVVEAPADNANSLETDLIEVADSGADIAEVQGEAEETSAVMEALDGIALCLGEAAKNGGLDRHSAQAVGIATEALYARVGIKRASFPALESFGGTSTRAAATKIAMEDIKEQMQKIWAAIVAAFEKVVAWIVDFYNKVTDAAGKLTKRGEELAKKATELKGEAKEKTITNERVAASLATSKGTADKAAIDHTVNLVKSAIGGEIAKKAEETSKNVIAAMDNVAKFVESFKMPAMGVGAMHKVDAAATGYEAAGEGVVCFRSDELVGGRTVLCYGPDAEAAGEAGVKAAAHSKYALAAFDPKKAPEAKELAVLSGADAAALANAAAELGKVLVAARDEGAKINESVKKMLEKAKSLGKAAAALDEKSEDAKNFKAAQTVAQFYARTANQPRATVASYGLSVGKSILDYVELSIKAYSAKAEEKKDGDKPAETAPAAATA